MKLNIYIDEAGRWPLAWPLYVWVVCPRSRFVKKHYRDSKILSAQTREDLFTKIETLEKKNQIFYSYWIVSSAEIDELRLSKAMQLAILRAIKSLLHKIYKSEIEPKLGSVLCSRDMLQGIKLQNAFVDKENILDSIQEIVLAFKWFGLFLDIKIDWNRRFAIDEILDSSVETIVDWDALIPEISMASIIAKVLRDREMIRLDKKYPNYKFAKHKWYATEEHRNLIKKHGPSEIHRKLFLKDYFPDYQKNSTNGRVKKS